MDYPTLFNTIKAYCENEFPATSFTGTDGVTVVDFSSPDQINAFIQQAETRIYNDAQIPALRKTATATLTGSSQYLDCPDDFLSPYSFAVIDTAGAYGFLLNKDVSFIREAYPIPTSTGLPKYYAINGTQVASAKELRFILGPTPDQSYAYELNYNYYPESIVTATNTWLGDNYDPVLLYGSMLESAIFMKTEADILAMYTAKYQEAIGQLKRLGDGLDRGDTFRDGQLKLPVQK